MLLVLTVITIAHISIPLNRHKLKDIAVSKAQTLYINFICATSVDVLRHVHYYNILILCSIWNQLDWTLFRMAFIRTCMAQSLQNNFTANWYTNTWHYWKLLNIIVTGICRHLCESCFVVIPERSLIAWDSHQNLISLMMKNEICTNKFCAFPLLYLSENVRNSIMKLCCL